MREANFAFPNQNRACVCISSQLYDRRALDTNAPLPLFNSLTHLTYLTSTSPRIREIMTMDGGLERLVRILHDFCMCPPPPENPMNFYGLTPPSAQSAKRVPTLNPKSFDKQAQYRFALAFQCVVNIGVRGSESIRSRVVQAGTLDVVGCILEAWLVGRGFPVGPSVGTSGIPRETKEQRLARRQALLGARQREQADQLARALQQQVIEPSRRLSAQPEDESMDAGASRNETPADSSSNTTPGGTNTPTGAVIVPGRERSGTVIARPQWDHPPVGAATATHTHGRRSRFLRREPPPDSAGPSTSTSADNSRPETETEDDGDVDMERESANGDEASTSGTPPPERRPSAAGTIRGPAVHTRRAVGIVSDTNPNAGGSLEMDNDVHIVINGQGDGVGGVGVEDGLVLLEANDDFAMGAPPGAPGAIDGPPARLGPDPPMPGERTPRAPATTLPHTIPINIPPVPTPNLRVTGDIAMTRTGRNHTSRGTNTAGTGGNAGGGAAGSSHGHHHHTRESEGPYREEDVLLSLQLLAYLSKYPHVRQAFYKPRSTFHPATAQLPLSDGRFGAAGPSNKAGVGAGGFGPIAPPSSTSAAAKEPSTFMKAYNSVTGRGKEKAVASPSDPVVPTAPMPTPSQRTTNVFALVERFTFRHSLVDMEGPNPPPSLPTEIQYWAGVIMRNACRKDDSRGGIRQCANMLCGRWESFPREFAKCRRCRKAKYCGKECQSLAWSEGHRFWCSVKDPEEDGEHGESSGTAPSGPSHAEGATPGRHERRAERERERHTRGHTADVQRQERREQLFTAARTGATIVRPGAPPIIDLGARDGVVVVNAGDGTPNDGAGPTRVTDNPDEMMLG